ncbi:MAG: hypothetical protein JWQ74_90 [Marmoricola sp.]|nr:hypothetical protein [Marmoricola sp.]
MNRTLRSPALLTPDFGTADWYAPGPRPGGPGPADPQGPGDIAVPEPEPTHPDGPGDVTNPAPCPTHGVDCTPDDGDQLEVPSRIDAGEAAGDQDGAELTWLLVGGPASVVPGSQAGQAVASRLRVSVSSCGSGLVRPMTGMKFASPDHRGTTCW